MTIHQWITENLGPRMRVREAAFMVVVPSPEECDRDVVIRKPNGQEILSSVCDLPLGFPSPMG